MPTAQEFILKQGVPTYVFTLWGTKLIPAAALPLLNGIAAIANRVEIQPIADITKFLTDLSS